MAHWKEDFLEIVLEDENAFRDKYLILGFHGIGNIGHLSIRYIIEGAKKKGTCRKVGYIIGRMMPPFVEVIDGGLFGVPYEFYHVGNAILLLIRIQPTLDEQSILADILTKYAKEKGIKGIILTGGIDISVFRTPEEIPDVVFVANRKFKEFMNDNPWNTLKPAPKEILVSGGVALFLAYATHYDIPVIALFAPTEKGIINFRGSLMLSKKIANLLNLPIDVSEIERRLRKIEEEMLRRAQEQMRGISEVVEEEWRKRETTEDFSTFT